MILEVFQRSLGIKFHSKAGEDPVVVNKTVGNAQAHWDFAGQVIEFERSESVGC